MDEKISMEDEMNTALNSIFTLLKCAVLVAHQLLLSIYLLPRIAEIKKRLHFF